MRVDVTNRRWRRFSAVVQLLLFAFSASTSLLPCASDMVIATSEQATAADPASTHHAPAPTHASHASHAATSQDTPKSPSSEHAPPSHTPSGSCPWVVGCSGLAQFTLETSWRLVETTPTVSAPAGVVLRATYAERDVESPPPRA